MTIPTGLAALIQRERRRQKLSLARLGELANVDRTLIWQLEKGKALNPTVLVLGAISTALDVPFHDVCDAALAGALSAREALSAKTGRGRKP